MAEPNVPGNSPVTAAADGSTASLLARDPRVFQNRTDGGKIESIYVHTLKTIKIGFRALTSAEQVKMEAFLDWAIQGRRFNWQPDSTATEALRLVLFPAAQITPEFTWLTRSETDYGELTFAEQLTRT